MALTVSVKSRSHAGQRFQVIADVTFGSSYPTGGESLTANGFGLTALESVTAEPAGGYIFQYDYANKTLKAFTPSVAHSHTENTDAVYTQNAATAASTASAATEAANATDLSGVTTRVVAVGY